MLSYNSSLHLLFHFRITPISSPDVLPSHPRVKKPSQHNMVDALSFKELVLIMCRFMYYLENFVVIQDSRFDCWRSRKDLNLADLLQM
ncbi:hypothetical protein Hanom_Chr01g00005111 [Helianthus anomalus]